MYRAPGVEASIAEPYGIDDRLFTVCPGAESVRDALGIAAGRVLMFAERVHPDKDLYRLLRELTAARDQRAGQRADALERLLCEINRTTMAACDPGPTGSQLSRHGLRAGSPAAALPASSTLGAAGDQMQEWL